MGLFLTHFQVVTYVRHKLSALDPEERKANCSICGLVYLKWKGYSSSGRPQWVCYKAWDQANKFRNKPPYFKYRKAYCEESNCTATIEHRCQLDVHHIDGNHKNNELNNLVTLCANCHRLRHMKS